jgi:hypothetical protein
MSPLSKRGHVRALQIPSHKRDDRIPQAEQFVILSSQDGHSLITNHQ